MSTGTPPRFCICALGSIHPDCPFHPAPVDDTDPDDMPRLNLGEPVARYVAHRVPDTAPVPTSTVADPHEEGFTPIESIVMVVLDSHGMGGWSLPATDEILAALTSAGWTVVRGEGLNHGDEMVPCEPTSVFSPAGFRFVPAWRRKPS